MNFIKIDHRRQMTTNSKYHKSHFKMLNKKLLIYIGILFTFLCSNAQTIKTGAEQTELYLHLLKDKNVSLVVNQSSIVDNTHLVDTLLNSGVNIKTIFVPEHGFRGKADAGETVQNDRDIKTGLPIISLYGKNKKPSSQQLEGTNLVIFDIQDVGVRFYTYISTMHYIMEACAENHIPLLIFDRPNPNGHYIDGPVLKKEYSSFVGMHPIPVVHGLTIGELAQMINGEGWLENEVQCQLTIIPVSGWNHDTPYELPIKPSPNLPNATAINLYPSLCFFEATTVSIGRGTTFPFQVIGSPLYNNNKFSFTPQSISGMSKHPKHENELCYGLDLRETKHLSEINLDYLIRFYQNSPQKDKFFTNPRFFNLLAGNKELQEQIKLGLSSEEIKKSWQKELNQYLLIRNKYLIYK